MKALKTILLIIVAIVAIYIVMALIGPKNYHVERSKVINAPEEVIWNQVAYFKNWSGWSPWEEKDPTVKNTYEGEDGTVGAVMKWEGDKDKSGTGQMVVTAMDKNKKMNYDLSFIVPFEMHSSGYFALETSENNSTKVTWVDEGNIPFMMRPMMLFMNLDSQIGPDFERGLTKIDSVSSLMYKQSQEKEVEAAVPVSDSLQVTEQKGE